MGKLKASEVEAKVRDLGGNLAAVARALGVTRAAVHKFVHSRPPLMAALTDCREGMKDNAESSLQRAVLAGESWAVKYYLSTQAKDRGYTINHEVSGPGGGAIPVQHDHSISPEAALMYLDAMERRAADGGVPGPASTNGALHPPPAAPPPAGAADRR